ncbi:hypothetical protein EJB05_12004, partial [Eragrostis curvula]
MLQVLTTGNAARLEELLISAGQTNGGHVAINLHATAPPDPGPGTHSSLLLGVTSNGNTALHLVASRGHVKLAALICERAPSLVGTRNRGLDTPLHCAARAGHREVAARLLSTMQSRGVEEAATLRATNRMGATALHEAVRHSREEVVDLFMAEAPDLASVTSDDGLSPLYLAATTRSVQMIRLLLRPSPDGTPSPASSAGPKGRTALHAAAIFCKVLAQKFDVVELFLNVDSQLASISDNEGSSPVHYAACWGNTKMIDVLTRKCPVYYELVDHDGRNLLHCAVMKNNDTVVRYICQNERFAMLLNMTDFDGDTPLHLAVMCGYPRIVTILLQSTRLDVNINNKDGLTALDLASYAFPSGRLPYILDPSVMVFHFLCWAGGNVSLDSMDSRNKDESAREDFTEKDYAKGTIASALIASVTFAAAFTIPGGIIADDHPLPGTAILARRFIFRAFVVSDIVAFLCSIVATGFLIYGGVIEIPRSLRQQYTMMSSLLVPTAAQFMIAAFAFGLHLVLGVANGGLIIFVYVVSSASVLFVAANTWIPLHVYGFAKAIWRRDGWKGLLKIHQRPFFFEATHQRSLGKLKLLWRLIYNPLAMLLGGSLALPMCATFFVAIALEICFPKLLS